MNWIQRILFGALDFLLPVRCILCGSVVSTGPDHRPFCGLEEHPLPTMTGAVCRQCSRPLRPGDPFATAGAGNQASELPDRSDLCGSCRRSNHALEFVIAGYQYEQPLRPILSDWKFGGRPEWADWLGNRLAEQLPDPLPGAPWDGLVPVPLHPDRLEDRGFNQACQLAESLSDVLGLPVQPLIEKHERTQPQSELSRKARLENLTGAFRIHGASRLLMNRSFLIVDDVYTTGSTLQTMGEVLLDGGARRVAGVVLARST